ncbi:hypothetical protein WDJ51_06915 [Rathayibacter sp. YIM 133350]|uniref:hypothetical protein n=1 Tax=Rathayibacter sp. YIM 133350 TaxID=3131992 RepID=UPI00307E70DB
MIIELLTPDASWSVLPREFPTPDGLDHDEWIGAVSALYAGSPAGSAAADAGELRELFDAARGQILPGDLHTLLFRPLEVPAIAIIHVEVLASDAVDSRSLDWALIPTVDLALPPIVEDVESPELGRGRKGAFIVADRFADDVTAGGLSYAFPTRHGVVHVFSSPSTPTIIGLLEAELDEIVNTIRIRESPAGQTADEEPRTEDSTR